jgi:hypothetical protein
VVERGSGVTARVRYAEGGKSLEVTSIYSWNRGDIAAPVMSSSSGPKDYIKNQIFAIFQDDPKINRVVMVRANGPTFFLYQVDGCWFDVTGKQVVQEPTA